MKLQLMFTMPNSPGQQIIEIVVGYKTMHDGSIQARNKAGNVSFNVCVD